MAREEISEVYCWKIETENLLIYLASSSKGAKRVGLRLGQGPDLIDFFNRELPDHRICIDEARNQTLINAINATLTGGSVSKLPDLDIRCTPFQREVLEKIALIPFGETRTYGEVALITGRPQGARAVGQVMNRNPLPLVFPWHRVVAAGGLGGFRGGIELKRYLIEREKRRL